MKSFIAGSPMRILEKACSRKLGGGNLGVFMARAGVGKTACLIHAAFESIFHGKGVIHVSLKESPDKVDAYYRLVYEEAVKSGEKTTMPVDYGTFTKGNKVILAYMGDSFRLESFKKNLTDLAKQLSFEPRMIIIDGLDFENATRSDFEGLKEAARDLHLEVWLSALSHRHIKEVNDNGIPYPCHRLDDLFSVIIQLWPEQEGIVLKLLKDHENSCLTDIALKLDPNTFLVDDA